MELEETTSQVRLGTVQKRTPCFFVLIDFDPDVNQGIKGMF